MENPGFQHVASLSLPIAPQTRRASTELQNEYHSVGVMGSDKTRSSEPLDTAAPAHAAQLHEVPATIA